MDTSYTGGHTVIPCPECGQKLRVPARDEVIHVRCPVCQTSWDWPRASSRADARNEEWILPTRRSAAGCLNPKRWRFRLTPLRFIGLVFLAVVGAVFYNAFTFESPGTKPDSVHGKSGEETVAQPIMPVPPVPKPPPKVVRTKMDPILAKPLPTEAELKPKSLDLPPEVELPKNGSGAFRFVREYEESKLRILPRGEQQHLVLKVLDATNGDLVCWFFVRKSETAEITIPPGRYRLKVASGEKWYGEKFLFGPYASYASIDNVITIPTHALYTISFERAIDGKLSETRIGPKDF